MNQLVLRFLFNAAWQVPLIAAVCWIVCRLLRRWPANWIAAAWRGSLVLSALLPVATTLWTLPIPQQTLGGGGFRISAVVAAVAAPAHRELPWVAIAYGCFVTIQALRLIASWKRLDGLNENNIAAPATFGFLKPRVLLPARFAAEAPDIARRAAIEHENCHVRRHDFIVNLLLEAVTLPVAFHPLLPWMKRRTADAVEMRCDEDAAKAFSDAKAYAQGLIEAARVLGAPPSPCLTAGFFDHNTFEERVMNLMQTKTTPRRWVRWTTTISLLAAGALVAGLATAYAAREEKVYKVGEEGVKSPKVLHKVEPAYSQSAKDDKVSGTVMLTLEIAPNGKAENIKVLHSLEPTLDQKAIEALEQWVFQPATKDDEPVRVSATIEVNFKLK